MKTPDGVFIIRRKSAEPRDNLVNKHILVFIKLIHIK